MEPSGSVEANLLRKTLRALDLVNSRRSTKKMNDLPILTDHPTRFPRLYRDVVPFRISLATLTLILLAQGNLFLSIHTGSLEIQVAVPWMKWCLLYSFVLGTVGSIAGLVGISRDGRDRCVIVTLSNLLAGYWPLGVILTHSLLSR